MRTLSRRRCQPLCRMPIRRAVRWSPPPRHGRCERRGPPELLAPSEASQLRALLSEGGVDNGVFEPRHAAALGGALTPSARRAQSRRVFACRAEDGGGLRRIVSFCEVEPRLRGRVLVLTHEEVDGHARQLFALPRAQLRAGEVWQDAARRALREALQHSTSAGSSSGADVTSSVQFDQASLATESTVDTPTAYPASVYPNLPCESTRYSVLATCDSLQGTAASERFCTPALQQPPSDESTSPRLGGGRGFAAARRRTRRRCRRQHHHLLLAGGGAASQAALGLVPHKEWETVKRKKTRRHRRGLRKPRRRLQRLGRAPASAPRALRRAGRHGSDDELGPAATRPR